MQTKHAQIRFPTLAELNTLTLCQQHLLQLRLLMASDGMTIMAAVMENKTIENLLDLADGILQMDDIHPGRDYSGLSTEEKTEYISLVEQFREMIGILNA